MSGRVLVTGGAGFIGSHLAEALVERAVEVRILDNLSTGKRRNLRRIEAKVEFLERDLRDVGACATACRGVDTVCHLAALGSVPRSIEDPVTTDAVNVYGTLNLLCAAREAGVRRVVFSSSSSVYGDAPVLPKHEGLCPNPRSPYAVSKMAAEAYCRAFFASYGLETVCLRYFNVFGPRQNPNSHYAAVIPRFISALLDGRRPVIYGDGRQSRDFTYVSNVVEANLLAATAPGVGGEVFNVACGEQATIRDVLERIAAIVDCEAAPEHLAPRHGDVRHSRADILAAWERLGYRPSVHFAEGLAKTVHFYITEKANARRSLAQMVAASVATT